MGGREGGRGGGDYLSAAHSDAYVCIFGDSWLGGQVVRRRSRKPKIRGSIPRRAYCRFYIQNRFHIYLAVEFLKKLNSCVEMDEWKK